MPYKISSTNIANLSYMGESFHGEITREGREFSMEGELDFPTLIKRSAIKYKTNFVNWKWEAALKLKKNKKYYVYLLNIFSFIQFSHLRITQLVTHFHKNSFNLFGCFVTKPYKISSADIANLSYVGESFHGEISRRRKGIFHGGGAGFLDVI